MPYLLRVTHLVKLVSDKDILRLEMSSALHSITRFIQHNFFLFFKEFVSCINKYCHRKIQQLLWEIVVIVN